MACAGSTWRQPVLDTIGGSMITAQHWRWDMRHTVCASGDDDYRLMRGAIDRR